MKLGVVNAHFGRDDVLIRHNWQILKVPKNVRNRLDLVCIDAQCLPEKFQTARLSSNEVTGVFVKSEHDEKKLNTIQITRMFTQRRLSMVIYDPIR